MKASELRAAVDNRIDRRAEGWATCILHSTDYARALGIPAEMALDERVLVTCDLGGTQIITFYARNLCGAPYGSHGWTVLWLAKASGGREASGGGTTALTWLSEAEHKQVLEYLRGGGEVALL
jgi:hypothetical protein